MVSWQLRTATGLLAMMTAAPLEVVTTATVGLPREYPGDGIAVHAVGGLLGTGTAGAIFDTDPGAVAHASTAASFSTGRDLTEDCKVLNRPLLD